MCVCMLVLKRERVCVCMCVCVCERERERDRLASAQLGPAAEQGEDNLKAFQDFRAKNGARQGQNPAVTGLCVPVRSKAAKLNEIAGEGNLHTILWSNELELGQLSSRTKSQGS